VQIAEQEILVLFASLVIHCCAVRRTLLLHTQLYDVADVQFTAE